MLARNDQPLGFDLNFANENNFNFGVDNVFSNSRSSGQNFKPGNSFLLLNGQPFLELNGGFLLLL